MRPLRTGATSAHFMAWEVIFLAHAGIYCGPHPTPL